MPEPEGIAGIIPPASEWRVGTRWRGLFTLAHYNDPYQCFAANRQCEQVFVREPIPYHCRPVTKPDPRSLCADRDARDHAGHGSDADACANANADSLRGDDESSAGDGHDGGPAHLVRQDNGDTGGDQAVLLGNGDADPNGDANLSAVRDADACDVLPEGGVDV